MSEGEPYQTPQQGDSFPAPSSEPGYYPTVPIAQPADVAPIYAPAPSRLSVWKIAGGVFVGNFVCLLLSLLLYFCAIMAFAILASASNR